MKRMLTKSVLTISALTLAVALSACGSEDPASSRVDGTWKITASGDLPSASWKVSPVCSSGPCDFKVSFGAGEPLATYKYDKSSGEYTNTNSATSDCLLASGKVGAKDAITVSSSNVFKPTAAESQDGESIATKATVSSEVKTSVSSAGKKAGCEGSGATQSTSQTAERSDTGS